MDKITRKPKGYGTVTFLMPEHAVKAYAELDGSVLDGRMLHLLPGKAKTSPEDIDLGTIVDTLYNHLSLFYIPDKSEKYTLPIAENLTYKQKKMVQLKATANSSHNWNTLFLGENAVVDVIASTYNTTKEKVIYEFTCRPRYPCFKFATICGSCAR